MYKVVFIDKKKVSQDLLRIPQIDQTKILNKMTSLEKYGVDTPQIKKLQSYRIADFRLRVGNYRVLLNIFPEKKEIHVIRILHRSKLY